MDAVEWIDLLLRDAILTCIFIIQTKSSGCARCMRSSAVELGSPGGNWLVDSGVSGKSWEAL